VPEAVEIRPATSADLDGVVASCAALFAEDAAARDHLRDQTWPAEHAAQWCTDLLADPAALVLVAASSGAVAGHLVGAYLESSAMWTAPRADLVSIRVDESLRGAGIGSRLVEAFASWARDRGAKRLRVDAYTANEDAIRFYRRHGFEPLSTTLAADL
jgi:GNAT superfamily N-acetyltransferase